MLRARGCILNPWPAHSSCCVAVHVELLAVVPSIRSLPFCPLLLLRCSVCCAAGCGEHQISGAGRAAAAQGGDAGAKRFLMLRGRGGGGSARGAAAVWCWCCRCQEASSAAAHPAFAPSPCLPMLSYACFLLQFKRAYRRNDKPVCMAAIKFIGHLANQQVRAASWRCCCSCCRRHCCCHCATAHAHACCRRRRHRCCRAVRTFPLYCAVRPHAVSSNPAFHRWCTSCSRWRCCCCCWRRPATTAWRWRWIS